MKKSLVALLLAVAYSDLIIDGGKIEGFANDLPLKDVLVQLVPSDYKVVNRGVDENQLVSWKGGKSWDQILTDVSENSHFKLRVNQENKEVVIGGGSNFKAKSLFPKTEAESMVSAPMIQKETAEPKVTELKKPVITTPVLIAPAVKPTPVKSEVKALVAKKVAVKETKTEVKTKTVKVEPVKIKESVISETSPVQIKSAPVQLKSVPVQLHTKNWMLKKGKTLKENITEWGKKEGWTVVWKAPDYRVVADTTLTGELDKETGPIISILKLYEDATLPLRVNILGGNKVIYVEGRNYKPSGEIDIESPIYKDL